MPELPPEHEQRLVQPDASAVDDELLVDAPRFADVIYMAGIGAHSLILAVPKVSIEDDSITQGFVVQSLYPNPSRDWITLTYDLSESSDVSVEIFDVLDRLVQRFDVGLPTVGACRSMQIP